MVVKICHALISQYLFLCFIMPRQNGKEDIMVEEQLMRMQYSPFLLFTWPRELFWPPHLSARSRNDWNDQKFQVTGVCDHVAPHQGVARSGSTCSCNPFSARKISSGLRRTGWLSSSRTTNRSNVRAKVTFSSDMAKFCPMQFLQGGERGQF